MLFFIKKLLGSLLMPLSIVLILLLISIVCALIHHKKKSPITQQLSLGSLVAGFVILFLSSTPFFSNQLAKPFEYQYQTFTKQEEPLSYIVILGCGHTTNDALPVISQLQICSLQRLIEGFRIYELHPEATIITSGYGASDIETNAVKVKRAAISLGIPANNIITYPTPKDTQEEAELIAPLLKGKAFALVTNASHMPRASQYFIQQRVNPIPAPTGFLMKGESTSLLGNMPKASTLRQTTIVWHEVLGRFVQWLKE